MKIIPKAGLIIKPDENGEYPDALAHRAVLAGLAVVDTSGDKRKGRKSKRAKK